MSATVRLRPVLEADLPDLERMFSDPEQLGWFNWGGWMNPNLVLKQWHENRMLSEENTRLIVEVAGESMGVVSVRKHMTTAFSHCWEFGISLWTHARGRGYGTAAQLALAHYLFAHTTVNRIQASTEVDNIAEQRALEKAGFIREAVHRGWHFRDGAWRDEVVYRMCRDELPPARS
jgi:RimJ/RimL family protein N-acetyltransferase